MRKATLLLPALLLTACVSSPTPPNPQPEPPVVNPQPEPQPQPPTGTTFIPQAGAAIGTGDGTKLGTVYVSPTQQEVEFMTLLNEARTKGTVNGVDVRPGTCLEGVTPGTLSPLTYNGVVAYASRKHSEYLGTWGYEAHYEKNSSHPNFYGYSPQDRFARAASELGTPTTGFGGEVITAGFEETAKTGTQAVLRLLKSPPHCNIMKDATIRSVGVGHVVAPYTNDGTKITYEQNWTAAFSF